MLARARRMGTDWVPLFVAVCLVAVNLRQMIAGVGPLLDAIAADQRFSPAVLGLLAAIPLLGWAVFSPFAQWLAAKIGLDAAVNWSLIGLVLATGWRSIPGTPANIWFGTGLIGASLAIVNVLLPAAIKRDFGRRIPLVMGVYSALIGASGALGAVMVAPIAQLQASGGVPLGWRPALLATGATVPVALAVWVWANKRRARSPQPASQQERQRQQTQSAQPGEGQQERQKAMPAVREQQHVAGRYAVRVWRDPVAWWIACYLGAQSAMFYIYASWIAPALTSRGIDAVTAGFDVTLVHIFGMIGSLLAPLCIRGGMARITPLLLPLFGIVGGTGVLLAPFGLLLWLAITGLVCGMSLSVALTFVAQRSPNIAAAGAVSGMAQAVGYLLAAAGPVVFGWLHGMSGTWGVPIVSLALAAVMQFVAGVALLRPRSVFAGDYSRAGSYP